MPRSVRLAEAPSYGKSIAEYSPSSRGALAYQAVTAELLERGGQAPGPALRGAKERYLAPPLIRTGEEA